MYNYEDGGINLMQIMCVLLIKENLCKIIFLLACVVVF